MNEEKIIYKIQFKRTSSNDFKPQSEGEISLAYGEPFIYQDENNHLHLLVGPNNGNETSIAEIHNFPLYVHASEVADAAKVANEAEHAKSSDIATIAGNGWEIEYTDNSTLKFTRGQQN